METCFWYIWGVGLKSRSYPTYEEWKLIFCSGIKFIGVSSYPTYEEWKHSPILNITSPLLVLILPMRNGNERFLVAFQNTVSVLILPMRNGNSKIFSPNSFNIFVLILPMRNGNYSFWRNSPVSIQVLILPMRNGNTRKQWYSNTPHNRSYPTYEE